MMLRRVQEAMADVAETLRRTFVGVRVRQRDPRFSRPGVAGFEVLGTRALDGLEPLAAPFGDRPWRLDTTLRLPELAFHANLQQESGWEAWASASQAVPVPLFWPGKAGRLEVPALPRKATAVRFLPERFGVSLRAFREPLRTPGTRQAPLAGQAPKTHRDLARAFRRPISFQGKAFAGLPRALQMRYTVQLVKATGENIRDLEVVGLFRVPRKGMGGLRLDPRNGGLLATLTEEAVGAPMDLLLLAKRKADQALLPCFLEES